VPAPLIRTVTGKGTRSKAPPNAYFCRSAAFIFRFRTSNAHGSAPSSMIIAVGLLAPWAPRVRRGVRLGCQWMMTKPSAVATAVGNPRTGMPRRARPGWSVALPLLSKTCPARSPPRCPPVPSAQTTSVSPLGLTAMAACLRDFAGDRLAQSLGGELVSEP